MSQSEYQRIREAEAAARKARDEAVAALAKEKKDAIDHLRLTGWYGVRHYDESEREQVVARILKP